MLATPVATKAKPTIAHKTESVFDQSDPRSYYRVLGDLDYILPDLAQPILRNLIATLRQAIGRPPRVLELGCGFGHLSALLRFPIDSERLVRRYGSPDLTTLDWRMLAELDFNYYRGWPMLTDAQFIGFDPSEHAIEFALKAGIFNATVAADLECEEPTTHSMRVLRDVDLIITAGAFGRIGLRTFRAILALQKYSRMPWIASFVPRTIAYDPLVSELDTFGLATEKLEGVTFAERRFCSRAEMDDAVKAVLARGLDPAGFETSGVRHAEFYLSRPRGSSETTALSDLITITHGMAPANGLITGKRGNRLK